MNERIKELALQAWKNTSDETAYLNRIHNRTISQDEVTDIFESKFAELIIRECMNLVKDCYEDPVSGQSQYQTACASTIIEDYFGVEE